MSENVQRGGRRDGAGRPKGSLNKRTLEAIQEVAERYPDWTPLLHLATVANDEQLDVVIRLDAAKAAAPYCHARLKPVVGNADELVDLEARIAEARAKSTLKEIASFGDLAERLLRAHARDGITASEDTELTRLRLMLGNVQLATGVPRAPDDPLTLDATRAAPDTHRTPPPLTERGLSDDEAVDADPCPPKATPLPTAQSVHYRSILPTAWPDEPAQFDSDYDPFAD